MALTEVVGRLCIVAEKFWSLRTTVSQTVVYKTFIPAPLPSPQIYLFRVS